MRFLIGMLMGILTMSSFCIPPSNVAVIAFIPWIVGCFVGGIVTYLWITPITPPLLKKTQKIILDEEEDGNWWKDDEKREEHLRKFYGDD